MVLCGAFPSLLATRTTSDKKKGRSEHDVPTVFTFQLSPGGSRGSITPGIVENFSSRSFESTRSTSSSRYSNEETSEFSGTRRMRRRTDGDNVGEFRNVRKALFDAATESESICTDPLLGSVVDIVNDTEGDEQCDKNVDDWPKNCTRRQLLWHAALQHHRSRHGKFKQQNDAQSLREKQLQELDQVVLQQRNNSKESLNTNIRTRGLSNIQQYLPSVSYSAGHDFDVRMHHQQQLEKHYRKHVSKYCPNCSCRLTYLYYSATTHRLTEIHSGCDTPSSKADSSLPPYCIGCRAYLIYEQWDEEKRKMLLKNFEKRLDVASPSSPRNDDVKGGPLEDFKNGKIVVVGSSSPASLGVDIQIDTSLSDDQVDQNNHVTPLHRNSSSEVSSIKSNSNNEEFEHDGNAAKFDDEMNRQPVIFSAMCLSNSNGEMKAPDRSAYDQDLLTQTHRYHKNDRNIFNSYEKRESVNCGTREDCENTNNDYNDFGTEKDDGGLELRDDVDFEGDSAGSDVPGDHSYDTSHRDPLFDLNDDCERDPPENEEIPCTISNPVGSDRENKMEANREQYARDQIPPDPKHSFNNRPPYEIIDKAITFKSPTLAAKALVSEARLAVASTFSEEFAIFQNYTVKKEAATKQIAKCLHRGYELTSVKCEQCDMPMMTRGEEGAICVSCPAIMKKVRRMVKEKRNHLKTSPVVTEKSNMKTPKTSNTRGNLVHQVGSYNKVAEESIESVALSGQTHIDFQNHLDMVREVVSGEDDDIKSLVRQAAIIRSDGCGAENLDKVEKGFYNIYDQDTEKNSTNQSVAVDHRDYWVSYTELHSNVAPHFPQPNLCSNSVTEGLQNPVYDQPVLSQTDCHPQQSFCDGNLHLQEPIVNVNDLRSTQCQSSYNIVNDSHEQHRNRVDYHQTYYTESTQRHDFAVKKRDLQSLRPRSSCHDVSIPSIAAGEDYYHNPSLEESVESITKCPRNLPSSDQIWRCNTSDYIMGRPLKNANHSYSSDRIQAMTNEGQSLRGYSLKSRKSPIGEMDWHTNTTEKGMTSHPSLNIYPTQTPDRTENQNVCYHVDTLKSPDGASSFTNTDISSEQFVEKTSHAQEHLLSLERCLEYTSQNERTGELLNACMPLSLEPNSNLEGLKRTYASSQNWNPPRLRPLESLTEQQRVSAANPALPVQTNKLLVQDHRNHTGVNKNASSHFETSSSSPANEERFCRTIGHFTGSLKRATSQFESRIVDGQKHSKNHADQHSRVPVFYSACESHLNSPGDANAEPFSITFQDTCTLPAKSFQPSSPCGRKFSHSFSHDSETNDDCQNLLTDSRLKKPSILYSNLRKPLEPLEGSNYDEHVRQHVSSADQRLPRLHIYHSHDSNIQMDEIRKPADPATPKRSGSDPPGHKATRRGTGVARPIRLRRNAGEAIIANNIHSPQNNGKIKEKLDEPRDPIRRNQCGTDPPESEYSQARGTDPKSSCDKNIHCSISSKQNVNEEPFSTRNRIALPETKYENWSSPKSTSTDVCISRVHNSSISCPKPLTSPATKESFQLNIPSWVDDEIETPIKPVNSFGETSMDQLLRKIDEIENDFSTIVASLPGSDGSSLKLSRSDDNSTLASKATFEIHQEAEQIRHQLASDSFESHGSQGKLITGILQQMRLVQHQIDQLECSELDYCSEEDYDSQGEMTELILRLANAAESLRSLQVE